MLDLTQLRAALGAAAQGRSDEDLLASYARVTKKSPGQVADEFGFMADGRGQWGNRFSASIDRYQAGLYGVGEAVTGSDWMRQRREANEFRANAAREWAGNQGAVGSFRDVNGFGSALNYVGGLAVDSAPYLAEALVGGVAARGLMSGTRAAAQTARAAGDTAGLARAQGRLALGSTAGAVGAGYTSSVGDILQSQRDQSGGQVDLLSAAALGVPYSALNALGVEGALARGTLARSVGKPLDKMTGPTGGVARAGMTGLRVGAVESVAETGQEFINQIGRNVVDPSAGYFGEEALDRYAESAVGGFALGGTFGAAGGGWRRSRGYQPPPAPESEYNAPPPVAPPAPPRGLQEAAAISRPATVDSATINRSVGVQSPTSDADYARRQRELEETLNAQTGRYQAAGANNWLEFPVTEGLASEIRAGVASGLEPSDQGMPADRVAAIAERFKDRIGSAKIGQRQAALLERVEALEAAGVAESEYSGVVDAVAQNKYALAEKALVELESVASERRFVEQGDLPSARRVRVERMFRPFAIGVHDQRNMAQAQQGKRVSFLQRMVSALGYENDAAVAVAENTVGAATAPSKLWVPLQRRATTLLQAINRAALPDDVKLAVSQRETQLKHLNASGKNISVALKVDSAIQIVEQLERILESQGQQPHPFTLDLEAPGGQPAQPNVAAPAPVAPGAPVGGASQPSGSLGDVRLLAPDAPGGVPGPAAAPAPGSNATAPVGPGDGAVGVGAVKAPVDPVERAKQLRARLDAVSPEDMSLLARWLGYGRPAESLQAIGDSLVSEQHPEGISKEAVRKKMRGILTNLGLPPDAELEAVRERFAVDDAAAVGRMTDASLGPTGQPRSMKGRMSEEDGTLQATASADFDVAVEREQALGDDVEVVMDTARAAEPVEGSETDADPVVDEDAGPATDTDALLDDVEAARAANLEATGANNALELRLAPDLAQNRVIPTDLEETADEYEAMRDDSQFAWGDLDVEFQAALVRSYAHNQLSGDRIDRVNEEQNDKRTQAQRRESRAQEKAAQQEAVRRELRGDEGGPARPGKRADVEGAGGQDQRPAEEVREAGAAGLAPKASVARTAKGSTVDQVRLEISRLNILDTNNRVVVVQSVQDLPMNAQVASEKESQTGGRVQGLYFNGKVYLVAGNIAPGRARSVFMHEVGAHLGLDKLLSPAQYARLVNKLTEWASRNDNSLESRLARQAMARVEAALTPDSDRNSELLAYFIEEAIDAGVDPTATQYKTELQRWLREFWAAFKTALRRLGVVHANKLTAQDVVNLAYGAARLQLDGKWHGTAANVHQFRTRYIGTGEGAQAYGWGLYFSGMRGVAEKYREQDVKRKRRDGPATSYRGQSYDDLLLQDAKNNAEAIAARWVLSILQQQVINNTYARGRSFADAQQTATTSIEADLRALEALRKTANVSGTNDGSLDRAIDELEAAVNIVAVFRERDFSVDAEYAKRKGNLYANDFAVADDEWLDWEVPRDQQSAKVQRAIAGMKLPRVYDQSLVDEAYMAAREDVVQGFDTAEERNAGRTVLREYLRLFEEGDGEHLPTAQELQQFVKLRNLPLHEDLVGDIVDFMKMDMDVAFDQREERGDGMDLYLRLVELAKHGKGPFAPGQPFRRSLGSNYMTVRDDELASRYLDSIGIKGIRVPVNYLSGGTRKRDGVNYVVFNEKNVIRAYNNPGKADRAAEPKFSVAPEPTRTTNLDTLPVPTAKLGGIKGLVNSLVKDGAWRTWPGVLGWFSGEQMAETFGKTPIGAAVKKFADLSSKMAGRAMQIKAQGDALLTRWEALKGKNTAAHEELNKLLLQSTEHGIWPQHGFRDKENMHVEDTAENRAVHAQLQQMWNQAGDPARKMYLDVLADLDKRYNAKVGALRSSVVSSFYPVDGDTEGLTREEVDRVATASPKDWPAITKELATTKRRKKELKHLQEDLEEQGGKLKRMPGPYFPIMRFGDHIVVIKSTAYQAAEKELVQAQEALRRAEGRAAPDADLDAERKAVKQASATLNALKNSSTDYRMDTFETIGEARQWREDVTPRLGEGYTVAQTIKDQYLRQVDAVSPTFMRRLEQKLASSFEGEKGEQIRLAVREMYLQMLPEQHMMKAQLKRRGVSGYNQDALRTFSASVVRDAHGISRLEFQAPLRDALDQLRFDRYNVDAKIAGAELAKRLEMNMRYEEHPALTGLTNITYLYRLGLSPSFLLTNLTQSWFISAPVMAARHHFKTFGVLRDAKIAAAKMMYADKQEQGTLRFQVDPKRALKAGQITEDESIMLQRMLESGRIDITITQDLGAAAEGDTRNWLEKSVQIAGLPAQQIEVLNRVGTALAAYRLEKQLQETKVSPTFSKQEALDKAFEYADKIVGETHLNYAAENRARHMHPNTWGGWGRVMWQFRTYQQGMIYLVMKNLQQAYKGDKEAQKALAYLSGTMIASAGVTGLPGIGAALFLAQALYGAFEDDDEEKDLRQMMYAGLESVNPTLANVVMKGLPTLIGADISERVGMGDILAPVRMGPDHLNPKDQALGYFASAVGGAGVGLGADLWKAANLVADGDYLKAAEAALPKFIADQFRAVRETTQGVTDSRGRVLVTPEERDFTDALARAAGIPTLEDTRRGERRRAFLDARGNRDEVRQRLLSKFARARIAGEPVDDVLADIRSFNERHPDARITPANRESAVRSTRAGNKELRGGVPVRERDQALAAELGI